MEELYGICSCTFNIHCLIHLAHCVVDCGPLWATSAFNFEANNHILLNMFSGTQYVPQQIINTFLLQNKVASLTRSCIDDNCSGYCQRYSTLQKLSDKAKHEHGTVCDGLALLASEKFVVIHVRQALAVQICLSINSKMATIIHSFLSTQE